MLLRVVEVFKNRITLNRMPVLNDWEDSELQSRLAEATYFNAGSTRTKGALNDFKYCKEYLQTFTFHLEKVEKFNYYAKQHSIEENK